MIRFVAPEAFLLVPLAALVLRRRLWPRPAVGVLRVLALLAIAALLAQPWLPGEADGRDVVLVLDRSRSMPEVGLARAREFVGAIEAERRPGDRLGVVAFGRAPAVERLPEAPFALPEPQRRLDVDGSDLAAAIDAAVALVPPGRQGSLLVVSDGEHNGGDLEAAARAAVRAGLRIDTLHVPRTVGRDVAVADLQAPSAVPVGQPFAIAAVVVAADAGPARWRLVADGVVLREGDAELVAGRNLLQFRHALAQPGLGRLAIEVERAGDPVPQNDRGEAVVRAMAPPRYLCVTPGGRDDRLTRSLRALGCEVEVAAPAAAPLTLAQLDGVRAVVLEDVAAGDLPRGGMQALAQWVRELGGGLLMTGGKASFGVGGYYRSPVEDVLPVTMEMREQLRRFGLAMAIALDRSGSMQAAAGDTTKMQLADRGAAAAVELLAKMDAVAVIAVDSAAHVVVPLQPVDDAAAIGGMVRAIESQGGGIYVGEALHAAAEQLAASPQRNRHIVLFADASDAEEPGDYRQFVPALQASGITVSVIGLGSASDSDAALLVEIAKLGGGRCQFVAEATDLPRVFAQETIQAARSSMVEEPCAVAVRPALALLGDLPGEFPDVGGYSLAWLRPRSELALQTVDEQAAPLLSYWQVGLGRAAAFLGEVDGPVSGNLATWDGYGSFFATLVRWLGGGQTPGLFVAARREGGVGVWELEIDDARSALFDRVRAVLAGPDGAAGELHFERLAPGRLVARVPLLRDGVYRAAVQLGDETVRVPPLALPYSPEFAPEPDARAGERRLRQLALWTGGRVQPNPAEVVAGPRVGPGRADLGAWFAGVALTLLLLEIVVRRFDLRLPVLPGLRRRRRAPSQAAADAVAAPRPVVAPSAPAAPPAPATSPPASSPAAGDGMLDALARAQQRSRRP